MIVMWQSILEWVPRASNIINYDFTQCSTSGMEKQVKMFKLRGQTLAGNRPLRTIKLDVDSELDIYVKYCCIANGAGYLYPHHVFVVVHDVLGADKPYIYKVTGLGNHVACINTWFSV